MEWFAFGIDPLLTFLELNLSGILVSSVPILGPALEGESFPLPNKEECLMTFLIKIFLELAANPRYIQSQFLDMLRVASGYNGFISIPFEKYNSNFFSI